MRHQKLIISILTLLFLCACTRTVRLSEADLRWIPYKGNETLIFKSNSGEVDTVFLTGSTEGTTPSDPLDVFPTYLGYFSIHSRYSDPTPPSGVHRYLEGTFVELHAAEDRSKYFELNHRGKNAWFYQSPSLQLSELDTAELLSLATKTKTYQDIMIFTPETNEYSDRDEFITRVFWSKSEGLIRYDKRDSIYWELTKKYSP